MHVLFRLSRVKSIVGVVQDVKQGSLAWLRTRDIGDFGWQDGYGAVSVSSQLVDRVIGYIKNQEQYHRKETFADEYRGFLRKCGGLEHKVDVHVIFSTKNRIPFLADEVVRLRLHRQLVEICEAIHCPCLRVGGIEDHVHILLRLPQDRPMAWVVQEMKKRSSAWLAARRLGENFYWQDGYGAFSISPQHAAAVIHYIENQEEHHREETFTDEFVRILQSHGIGDRNPTIWE